MEIKVRINDPILRSYLRGLFEMRDGGFAVTMDTLTGAALCSLVRTADYPRKREDDPSMVLFFLPRSRYTDSLRNKSLYLTPEAERKIIATLKREFETDFLLFMTESRIQGFKLRDIITTFIVDRNMDIFDGDIETLKKKYYRKEMELLNKIPEKMRKLAYSAAKMVRETMQNASIL